MNEADWLDPEAVKRYMAEHKDHSFHCARGKSGSLCLKRLELKDDGLLHCPKHGLDWRND